MKPSLVMYLDANHLGMDMSESDPSTSSSHMITALFCFKNLDSVIPKVVRNIFYIRPPSLRHTDLASPGCFENKIPWSCIGIRTMVLCTSSSSKKLSTELDNVFRSLARNKSARLVYSLNHRCRSSDATNCPSNLSSFTGDVIFVTWTVPCESGEESNITLKAKGLNCILNTSADNEIASHGTFH